ncbi:glycosyltransferase family A protein [Acinetobacter haemolyticus]|uniref:glycosyltransferase family A protein n=1 Tax=Acinetobacter haemolyticus TaxID=29430 RepID=UPI003AF5730E
MKDFEVAVSCLNKDVFKIVSNFKNLFGLKSVDIHVIHQITDDFDYSNIVFDLESKSNIRYSRLEKLGLPHSRNFALDSCSAKFLIPTDSDVIIFDSNLERINDYLINNSHLDFLTLESYYDLSQENPRRAFANKEFLHNRRTLLSVSSIEIVMNVERFKLSNVEWDLDFGLGARFGGGLETVMLQNANNAGLKGMFVPIPLSCHHELSTGAEVNIKRVFIRSAVFEKIFGTANGKILSLIFHIKNYKKFKSLGILNLLKTIMGDKKI